MSATETGARPRHPGGRPRIGDQVSISFPPDALARVDAAAMRDGITRSEWVRPACLAALG